jgi:ElaA protein
VHLYLQFFISGRVATEQFKAKKIYLEAQEYAIGYYAKEGFEVVAEPFMEDGIPHVKMEKLTI